MREGGRYNVAYSILERVNYRRLFLHYTCALENYSGTLVHDGEGEVVCGLDIAW